MKANRGNFRIWAFVSSTSIAETRKISGIMNFAGEAHDWDVFLFTHEQIDANTLKLISSTKPDGVIVSNLKLLGQLQKRLGADIPSVLIDGLTDSTGKHPVIRTPKLQIACDNNSLGQTAAEVFIRLGVKGFAYAGIAPNGQDDDHIHSQQRLAAYRKRLRQHGNVYVYEEPLRYSIQRYTDTKALDAWLRSLPKPCGIFAFSDILSLSVLQSCNRNAIPIPESVLILGVDNDLDICENAYPTLSSIELDFTGAGHRAAEMLDSLIRHRRLPRKRKDTYHIKSTCLRMSTQNTSGASRRIARAREIIRLRAFSPLKVSDIANELGISVRSLEQGFQSATGHTIRDEITNLRLLEMQRLLNETDRPVEQIGYECGFNTAIAAKVLFKRKLGMSMSSWRKQNERKIRLLTN